ncbi:hypothetical protein HY992_05195 [Candidatus Micrarchaeota archaeon]|nr:hypothetical protein [Candidatus Micrarchaeota archaeon]
MFISRNRVHNGTHTNHGSPSRSQRRQSSALSSAFLQLRSDISRQAYPPERLKREVHSAVPRGLLFKGEKRLLLSEINRKEAECMHAYRQFAGVLTDELSRAASSQEVQ